MVFKPHEKAVENRTDISDFLVHLTRSNDGKTALENLISILKDRRIIAKTHHNLFTPLLKEKPTEIADSYNVVCFTEVPLSNIQHFIGVKHRQIQLEQYGIVFAKSWIAKKAGNPVFYVYEENTLLKDAIDNLFDFDQSLAPLFSLVSKVGANYRFEWEREWRVLGDLCFAPDEIVAIVCPEEKHKLLESAIVWASMVPLIDVYWDESVTMTRIKDSNAHIRERLIANIVSFEDACTDQDPQGNVYAEYTKLCRRSLPSREITDQAATISELLKPMLPDVAARISSLKREITSLCEAPEIIGLLNFDFDDYYRRIKGVGNAINGYGRLGNATSEALSAAGDQRTRLVNAATKPLDRLRAKVNELREEVELSFRDW